MFMDEYKFLFEKKNVSTGINILWQNLSTTSLSIL